jgi:hypothetical protein
MTTSVNTSAMRSGGGRSIARLAATMPPKALTGSPSSARAYAVSRSSATAMPAGLVCLMMATPGSAMSVAIPHAASVSSRLL